MIIKVRGKKNLVISKDLAGPVGLFVKFSVLQEYGVDRVFLLENANVDSSQRNVVFLVHAEKVNQVATVAGTSIYRPLRVFWLCSPIVSSCPRSIDFAFLSRIHHV
jgi:hypothetical protein